MKLALIALLAVSTLAYAAPTPEHAAAVAAIKAQYAADAKTCTELFQGTRRNGCIHDAAATQKKATEGERIAEKGRQQLAAKNAAMEKAAAKESAKAVLPVPSDKPKP